MNVKEEEVLGTEWPWVSVRTVEEADSKHPEWESQGKGGEVKPCLGRRKFESQDQEKELIYKEYVSSWFYIS